MSEGKRDRGCVWGWLSRFIWGVKKDVRPQIFVRFWLLAKSVLWISSGECFKSYFVISIVFA